MKSVLKVSVLCCSVAMLSACVEKPELLWDKQPNVKAKRALGQKLFFDTNLSRDRNQSCATCHNPAMGFVDDRDNGVAGAVSQGSDGHSLGDRTAPTAAYASFSPSFHQNKQGQWVGGQFWDGRANTLSDQAGGPPVNPLEMAMKDKTDTVNRLLENPQYEKDFRTIYGNDIFSNIDAAFWAMTDSVSEFEKTDFFSPFDSKYDRYLKGEVALTEQEELGRTLFFSQQFTNCNQCHQLRASQRNIKETFTNYQYHNIGVPENIRLRMRNSVALGTVDIGLLNNPAVTSELAKGKFKVPTLRNVAVTGPYMHNGVFTDLKTVVLFYDKYNSRSAKRKVNPETKQLWRAPEYATTVSIKELEHGPALDDRKVNALVSFLKTLTDKRYEHLLD